MLAEEVNSHERRAATIQAPARLGPDNDIAEYEGFYAA